MSLADPDEARERAGVEPRRHRWMQEARDVVTALGHLLLMPFDPPTCLRGALTGERRVAWSRAIPLERVKAIAHARVGTVNDVLMGALTGALRRYMIERDPCALRVRAIVPVNLRPESGYDESHGNWFGLVFPELPLDVADADGRLSAVESEMQRIKGSQEAVVALGILAALGRSPTVIDHVVQEIFARKATLVVTNVPGPRRKLQIAGRTIEDMWFWVPHPCGLAVGASIMSYAGNLRVGIRTDAGVVKDPETIARYFEEELGRW
jgi:diacylglycerol O-acyltransferase